MAEYLAIGIGALIVGVSKASVGGLGLVAAALFAEVMPARQSTAAVLLILICGDLLAAFAYRRDVEWRTLLRLAPTVLVGILLGTGFLAWTDDALMRRVLGIVILAMVLLQLALRRRPKPDHLPHVVTAAAGVTAGFTSMVANAAGAVMAVYLLNMHIGVRRYLGTTAWFFLALNLTKLPFSIGLGLLPAERALSLLWFVPVVALGVLIGRRLVQRMSMDAFQWLTLGAALLGGLNLLVR